jgi:flagellar hook-length control protein FliK
LDLGPGLAAFGATDPASNAASASSADGSQPAPSTGGNALSPQSAPPPSLAAAAMATASPQAQPNPPAADIGNATVGSAVPFAPQAPVPTPANNSKIATGPSPPGPADRIAGALSGALAVSGGSPSPRPSHQDSVPDVSGSVGGPVSSGDGNAPTLVVSGGAGLHGDNANSGFGDTSASFGTGLASHVAAMIAAGHQETTLHLQPAQLGELTIRVAVQGRDVSTWFSAPQPQVQLAVSQALDQLRSGLSNAGLNLAGAWVGADASGTPQWSFDNPAPSARRGGFTAISPTAPAADAGGVARNAAGVSVYV